ncbi:MAG: thiamine pyrophosphate-binding protein, partial [Candidatus Puniceispirillaceae bacterium]
MTAVQESSKTASAKSKAAKTQMMPGAALLLKVLEAEGVEVIFGYPGGAVLPIYDEIFKSNAIRHILVRHEQAAVHAAEGYARSTGKVGVVLVTSGPGATNAVTGLTDALMDSVPIVCLTGQVPSHLIGTDAFQEGDTSGITRPCTKHNYLVKQSADLQRSIEEAFHVARTGRPGPVVIDLPKDIQMLDAPYQEGGVWADKPHRYRPVLSPDKTAIKKAVQMMKAAKRPVIYGGGGIINSGPEATKGLRKLVEVTGWPTTLTLMGLGALPADDPHFLGMLGMHGTYEANLTMHGCDFMLNLGARFDDRVTGRLNAFSPNSVKVHADIDPASVNKVVRVDLAIIGDVKQTIAALLEEMKAQNFAPNTKALSGWWDQINAW